MNDPYERPKLPYDEPSLVMRISEARNYLTVRSNSHTPEESEVTLTDLRDILDLMEEMAQAIQDKEMWRF